MGGGFTHGKIDPLTGYNTRLGDFKKSLSLTIDRALAEPVDLVLFGGDAFPDSTPAPYIQEIFSDQFYRLVEADIPIIFLVGNHDQHAQGQGGSSLSIYRSLRVSKTIVGDTIATYPIATKSGLIQIVTLPWINKSTLITCEQAENLSIPEANVLLLDKLKAALDFEISKLDPAKPAILLAHLMADSAACGAEKTLIVGRGFTVPVTMLAQPCFNYVALGHVHRHQNLNKSNDPAVVYPGSIERVDFGEEKEDKGFVLITIRDTAPWTTTWEFCPLPVRAFKTIKVDISTSKTPQADLLLAIEQVDLTETVIRLRYTLDPAQIELIDGNQIRKALETAHHFTVQPELLAPIAQPRLKELSSFVEDPLATLSLYLDSRADLKSLAKEMAEAAKLLLETSP